MNYRRGFFRAWVLLTVLWVVGVAYVSGPDLYPEFKLIGPPGTHDPWDSLLRSTAVAFLPPLALLALGAMLGWAFSGFRRQT